MSKGTRKPLLYGHFHGRFTCAGPNIANTPKRNRYKPDEPCRYCINMTEPHQLVCDYCGCDHNNHIYSGGCLHCYDCPGYSQRKQLTRQEYLCKKSKSKQTRKASQ